MKRSWWAVSRAVLERYNERTGSTLQALTGSGQPSENAKRIYGRVREWPDLTIAQHDLIIERTLASQWWGKGAPSVGVIYGPKVFEDNMVREAGSTKDAAKSKRAAEDRAAIKRIIERRRSGG